MRIPALNPTVLILPPRGYWELSGREFLNSSLMIHVEQGQQLLWESLPVILLDIDIMLFRISFVALFAYLYFICRCFMITHHSIFFLCGDRRVF